MKTKSCKCGERPTLFENIGAPETFNGMWSNELRVGCEGCGMTAGVSTSRDGAIKKWNRKVGV